MKASTSKTSSTTTNPDAIQVFQNAQATLPTSYSPVTGSQINGFMNPYTSSVIDATTQQNNQNQQLALNQIGDQAQKAGAFGGTRQGVAEALTRGQFDLNNQQTTAQLNSQNYSQALAAATAQNQAENQYPLAVQGLLGQLAAGTQTNSTGKATSTTLSVNPTLSTPLGSISIGGGDTR
jgi:hypothetical protein